MRPRRARLGNGGREARAWGPEKACNSAGLWGSPSTEAGRGQITEGTLGQTPTPVKAPAFSTHSLLWGVQAAVCLSRSHPFHVILSLNLYRLQNPQPRSLGNTVSLLFFLSSCAFFVLV